jgi:hypothetical protein
MRKQHPLLNRQPLQNFSIVVSLFSAQDILHSNNVKLWLATEHSA